jgi:hypothetical protein
MSTVNELMGSICQKTNNKLTHTCIDMLDEHIYFFLQYIGQSFLTGNRSVSLNKKKRKRRIFILPDTCKSFFEEDKEQKVHHILFLTCSIVLYSNHQLFIPIETILPSFSLSLAFSFYLKYVIQHWFKCVFNFIYRYIYSTLFVSIW